MAGEYSLIREAFSVPAREQPLVYIDHIHRAMATQFELEAFGEAAREKGLAKIDENGAGERNRTPDRLITNAVLAFLTVLDSL